MKDNILRSLLARRGTLVLDGAMATELEHAGCDLNHSLWSARVMIESPEHIAAVHRSYLEAGCDLIASATYQASIPGFVAEGFSTAAAEELFSQTIRLASRERDRFVRERQIASEDEPLVAISLGPFGAYLADGSEYRGNYAATLPEIEHFHVERLARVAEEIRTGHADLVAIETVPSLTEARLCARILESLQIPGWISFSCKDGRSTCEGQDIEECARVLDAATSVIGVGVNCSRPEFMAELLEGLGRGTDKPLLAYPNSGEVYNAHTHSWHGDSILSDVETGAARWRAAGASVIGGCCRTTPSDIAELVSWRNSAAG
jgi:homocysteine S-methyltransferase